MLNYSEYNDKPVCLFDNLGRKVIGRLEVESLDVNKDIITELTLVHPCEIGVDSNTNSLMMVDWLPHTSAKRWQFDEKFPVGVSSLDGEIEDYWLKQTGQKLIEVVEKPKIII